MDKNDLDYQVRRGVALAFWGGFYRCPTTGRIIEALRGDDKALCNCRTSNPAVPTEATHRTGTHIVRFLEQATVDDYLAQRDRDGRKGGKREERTNS